MKKSKPLNKPNWPYVTPKIPKEPKIVLRRHPRKECYKKRIEILACLKAYGEKDFGELLELVGPENLSGRLNSLLATGNIVRIKVLGRGYSTYKFVKFYD